MLFKGSSNPVLADCIGLLAIDHLEKGKISDGDLVGTTFAARCAEYNQPEDFAEIRKLVDDKIIVAKDLGSFHLVWDEPLSDYRVFSVST